MTKLTKCELMQVKYLNNEIKMWKEELEQCKYDLALQSPNLEKIGQSSDISDKTAVLASKIIEIKDKIDEMLIKIQIQRKKIIDFIDLQENSLTRQILFLKYISGLTWTEISLETGSYNSPDNLRILHDRFLKSSNSENKA